MVVRDVTRVVVPVEQLWHRVPGGTARATVETLLALAALDGIETQGVAGWHRPAHRDRAGAAGIGPVTYLPVPRPVLYEAWLRFDRPPIERVLGWARRTPLTGKPGGAGEDGGAGEADVVWASSMIPPPSRAPLVATVHDLGFLDHPEHTSRRGRSFFPRAWDAVRDRAEVIVCPSQTVADDCANHGIGPDRLRVVGWGVTPPASPPTPHQSARVRASLGLPERFVLWVGTLEPRKNLPRLVAAMQQVPTVPLVVVGPDGWELDGADVLAPLGDRAHRLGAVDEATLSSLYTAASVFAFPSLVEGFGLPVLEAMAHGTPVVTSAGTATAEVAGDAARLVDPHDPASIAAGIGAALERDVTTFTLVERGLDRADEFSWSATAERYAAVFDEVAGKR